MFGNARRSIGTASAYGASFGSGHKSGSSTWPSTVPGRGVRSERGRKIFLPRDWRQRVGLLHATFLRSGEGNGCAVQLHWRNRFAANDPGRRLHYLARPGIQAHDAIARIPGPVFFGGASHPNHQHTRRLWPEKSCWRFAFIEMPTNLRRPAERRQFVRRSTDGFGLCEKQAHQKSDRRRSGLEHLASFLWIDSIWQLRHSPVQSFPGG